MPRTRVTDGAARYAAVLGLLVVAALGVTAYFLADTQAEQRSDLRERYAERTRVAGALLDSLFAVAAQDSVDEARQRYTGDTVPARVLSGEARRSNARWLTVLDASGRIVGASPATPRAVRDELAGLPAHVRSALLPRGHGLSDQRDGVIQFAVGFDARDGRRVLVSASRAEVYASFLGGTLAPLPGARRARAYVFDGAGMILSAVEAGGGQPTPRPALVRRSATETEGIAQADDGERFFAAARLPHSSWRIVVTVPTRDLYATASGASRWLPWTIFGATLALLAGAALMLRRLLRVTRALQRANTELERSNADLEQFAYAASHDLSEPLRTVAGFSQLLGRRYRGRLDEEADLYIEHMAVGVDRMQQLIDDLLLYSRVGRTPMTAGPVGLEGVLGEVLASVEPMVAERGAEVTHDPLPTVHGERAQLGQVLQNLIVNAMKFTAPDVTPRIRVSAHRVADGWRIDVRDNGIGVEERQREAIFKMFGRLHAGDDYPGTGIGLALVKRIIERHGGSVWVRPAEGGGSVFSFTVPAHAVDGTPAPSREEVPA